jgi:hypothetical protein
MQASPILFGNIDHLDFMALARSSEQISIAISRAVTGLLLVTTSGRPIEMYLQGAKRKLCGNICHLGKALGAR